MKRTKNINKLRFRKGFVLAGIVASSFALSGCEVADETVKMYQSADQCQTLEGEGSAQCKTAYETAKTEHEKSAPKFESSSDCASEFGTCEYNSSSSSFMPMMMGFMMGNMMSNASNSFRSSPVYSSPSGKYMDIRKNTYSGISPGKSFKTYNSTMKSQPASARQATSSRGGFGSSVSSRSSFGG